jgi:RNA polymerase sigma factor FliA
LTRDELILSLAPQVNGAVRRLQESLPRQVTHDDLIGHAWIGAAQAVDSFKPNHGVELGAFAQNRIRGAMLDYLRSLDTNTREERRVDKKTQKARHKLTAALKREPTDAEVQAELGLSPKKHVKFAPTRLNVSLTFPDGEPVELRVPTPDHTASLDQATLIQRILAVLPPREYLAVRLYFWEEQTMLTISKRFGVNESCVSQIIARARKRMAVAAHA